MTDTTSHTASSSHFPPSDWVETTLGEVCEIIMGQSPKGETYNLDGDGLPFYQGVTEFDEKYVKIKTYTSEPTKIIESNTILFSVRAPVGRVNFTKHKSCIGRGNAGLKMNNGNQEFLFYLLRLLEKQIQNRTSGTVFDSISGKELKEVPIIIPTNPDEQQAIASVLSAFDDKIELLREQNKTLEEMGQVIFQEWFGKYGVDDDKVNAEGREGGLGQLPEGWRVGKLGEVVDLLNGFAYKSSDFTENGKYRLVTIANVQDGSFVENTKDGLGEIPQKMPDYCNLKTGDILLSLTGNVGRVCHVIGENYFLNQRVAKLQAKEKQDYGFIYTMFRQNSMIGLLESISAGTAQQNLSPIKTKELEIIIPSRAILNDFANTINPMIDKMLDNKIQIQSLARSRDELLPRLMSGMLRVKF